MNGLSLNGGQAEAEAARDQSRDIMKEWSVGTKQMCASNMAVLIERDGLLSDSP